MSARVQIIANDISLDVYADFDEQFWITRVVHDIKNLSTRNASFTKSFTVPATASNVSTLGPSLSVFNIPNLSGIKKIPCTVLMDGMTVLSHGDLIIRNVTGKYIALELELFWGNFDFFEKLRTVELTDLDYSDLDLTWDIAGVTAIGENTTGIVFCRDEWTDAEDMTDLGLSIPGFVRTYHDIRLNGFWIYTKEIIERLALNSGYTLDDSEVIWDKWDTAALACSAHKWVEIEPKATPITGNIEKNNNETQTDTDQIVPIGFDGTVLDPDGQWAGAPSYAWDIDTGADPNLTIVFKAILNIVHTQLNPSSTPFVAIRLNSVIVVIHNFVSSSTGTITLEVEEVVVTGDIIDCVGFAPNGPGSNGSSIQILASGTSFELTEVAGIDPDDSLEVNKYIPQISATSFVVSLCNMANIIIFADEANKVVKFISFDSILTAEQQDLSSKIAVNKKISSTNTITTFFQNNEFKYGKKGNILRTDTDGEKFFNDELLDIRGTLIEIGFDACDNALWVGAGACSASFYTKERNSATGVFVSAGFSIFTTTDAEEWNIGDYIEINTSGGTIETMRIIGKTTDLIGTIVGTWRFTVGSSSQPYFIHKHKHTAFDVARIANINQTSGSISVVDGTLNGSTPTSVNVFIAEFDSEMTFQFLIDNEYENLLNVLEKPLVIQAWFILSTLEYVQLQQSKLAYINFFDSVFYINKIEQYKVGKPVRLELIRARQFG